MNGAQPLAGRHALVTGGSKGIGYAIAQCLAEQGARVTLVGRGVDALERAMKSLAAYGEIAYACADISLQQDVGAAFAKAKEQFGVIDILVNNAGQATSQRFDRIEEADWHQLIAVNLSGTFHCMQAALPDMLEAKWGRIVNVASTAGLVGYPYVSAYCAAKHGVIGLTRALAQETAKKGVTVNAVCPGYTETDIVQDAIANITQRTGMSAQEAKDKLAERNPQGRLIQPGEVAQAVAWLCQAGSASINGQAIPIDGGEVTVG